MESLGLQFTNQWHKITKPPCLLAYLGNGGNNVTHLIGGLDVTIDEACSGQRSPYSVNVHLQISEGMLFRRA